MSKLFNEYKRISIVHQGLYINLKSILFFLKISGMLSSLFKFMFAMLHLNEWYNIRMGVQKKLCRIKHYNHYVYKDKGIGSTIFFPFQKPTRNERFFVRKICCSKTKCLVVIMPILLRPNHTILFLSLFFHY